MTDITFITGNQNKADYLSKYLGLKINHIKIDLEEVQSLDIKTVVRKKLKQAYKEINKPVVVEDVSLEFVALGRLPGTFIKFFVEEVPFETICRTLDGLNRAAIARCVYGYYDGKRMELFESSLKGKIAEHPRGENGWGWDKIFIPSGYELTRAELSEEDDRITYLKIKPLQKLKDFIDNNMN